MGGVVKSFGFGFGLWLMIMMMMCRHGPRQMAIMQRAQPFITGQRVQGAINNAFYE